MFCFALAAAALPAWAEPPQIVSIAPKPDAKDVPVDLKEIKVTFDRDMDRGGFSFTGGGPTFPEIDGKPAWKSARECVLPVKLVPGKNYVVGLNSERFRNFRSREGVPLVPVVIRFTTAGKPAPGGEGEFDAAVALEKLREAIGTRYSYRDTRKINWLGLWAGHEEELADAGDAAAFAKVAGEMLSATRDIHIWLELDGEVIPAYRRDTRPNADFGSLPRRVGDWKQHGKTIATGKLGDGTGYIAVLRFSGEKPDFEPFFAALESFTDLPSLVIDVRFNSGGSEMIARELAGCFVEEKALYAKHVPVDPGTESGFGNVQERWLHPTPGRPRFGGKVAVLTGPVVMSSAEAFLLMMKQVDGCKLVGARSYGSSGNPLPHDLGGGLEVMLPSWKAMDPRGNVIEGEGIEPDIGVRSIASDFEKRDPVLDAAVEWLDSEG